MIKRLLLLSLLLAPAAFAVDVEGYVYTPDGTPVAKAAVSSGAQRATTGSDGHFTLTAPADSVVTLHVTADDLPSIKVLALAGDPPLTITLGAPRNEGMIETTAAAMPASRAPRPPSNLTRDRVVTGTVRIGKRALANAPVTLHAISEVYIEPLTVTSDDKGRYRAALPARRYVVSIGEGLAPRLRSIHDGRMHGDGEIPSLADVTRASEAVVDVELVAAQMITGRVVDAADKPVARADVLLAMAGRSALEFLHQPIVRTLPDGSFAVPAPMFPESERLEVVVTPPRHSPTRSKPFVLSEARPVTITLPKFDSVTVRVVDRAGKPIPDAFVTYALGDETSNFGGDAAVLLMPHVARRRIPTTAGEVTLQLTPGEYQFAASAPKYQPRTETRSIVRAVSFDIALQPGYAIRGRVHRAGKPVHGVQVTIRGGRAPRGERAVTTDEKGLFQFDSLPRGTYTLGFFKSEEMIDKMLTIDAPGEAHLELPPAGTLQGRVIDASTRTPVAQFFYSIEPVEQDEDGTMRTRHMQRGASGADGAFSTTVPVGIYRVTAGSHGYLPSEPIEVRVTDREPAFVEVPLGRGATVTGRVTDEEGRPLLEAHITVAGDMGEIARSARPMSRVAPMSATTGEDGTFTITGIENGQQQLIARRAGYVLQRRAIDVEGETRVDITMTRGLTLSGVVTLNDKPVAGASVDASTSAINADHQSALTDERGRFTLEGLIPARYTVNANHQEYHTQVEHVDVTQRRELVIELEGKGTGVIFGTVSGMPPAGRQLRGTVFAQSVHRGAEGTIDAAGNFRIEKAPAGTLDVVAHLETPQGTRSTSRRKVELAPGQSLRVDLDLTPALTVSGRVTHGSSKPVSRAHVVFNSEEAGMVTAITREDGSYEVGLPAPGRYQIFANAEELLSRHFQTVREIRGTETFDIHLAEQTVEGVVVDAATQQPLANALVTLVPAAALQTRMPSVSAETVTNASGRFTMVTAAAGPHLLIASAAGYAQRAQEVTIGGTDAIRAQFALEPASELRVRVVDARNRTPLEAHLVIGDAKGNYLPVRAQRSADGTEFVFSLAPGTYRLTVVTMGYPEKKVEVSAPGVAVVPME